MGFRGRISLRSAVGGVVLATAAFVLAGTAELVPAVQTAGQVVAGLGVVLAVAAAAVVLGLGRLDDEIESRSWWALSLLADGAGLVVLGLGAQRTPPGDLEARLAYSTGTIVVFVLFGLLGLVEWWAERRAAPSVECGFYRRRKPVGSEDPYRFVGDRR